MMEAVRGQALSEVNSFRVGRVLVAKLGLDGHDVGAKVVARLLRDAGFEVIYLSIRQTAETIVGAALAEDVDVIGLSILSGSHVPLVERLFGLIAEQSDWSPPVVVGGVIPVTDNETLLALGVRAIFTAGTPWAEMVATIRELASEAR